jgi:hypothetical protein
VAKRHTLGTVRELVNRNLRLLEAPGRLAVFGRAYYGDRRTGSDRRGRNSNYGSSVRGGASEPRMFCPRTLEKKPR